MFKLPKEVIDSIGEYKTALAEFLELKINPARFKGIRVPWGIYNQRGGKSFMVRIRVVAGGLDAGQLNALARTSRLYGNGILHITTRQDVQIHDVKIEDTIKIIEELKDYNLSPRGGGGNTVRNIVICPLAGLCEDEAFDTRSYVTALSEYLLKSPDSYTLPRKLKIAFSGCGKDCALATITDIGFIAKTKGSTKGFKVYAGGGMGSHSRAGTLLEDFVAEDQVGYVAEAVKKVFSKYGERKDRQHARLRFLVEKIGPDKFKELYEKEIARLKESEHIALREVDYKPSARKGYHIARINVPLGDLGAEDAAALAGLAARIPGITFRTSQRQDIYIANIPPDDIEVVNDELKRIGRGRLQNNKAIVCCAGVTTCNLGICNSRGLAKEIERVLEDVSLCRTALEGISINVNGCPNSCGQHPVGTIGLHGLARKVGVRTAPFYRIFVGGIAEEARTALGRDMGIVPSKNTPLLIKDFLVKINPELKEGLDVHQYILEKGVPIMKELVKRYAYVPDFEEDRSFYKDWGKDELFTLEGLTQGECGAGVIDMIESDLDEAKRNLALARTEGFSAKYAKEAIHLSSRAMLIVKGIEPRTATGAIDSFKSEFIDKAIASSRFKNIRDVYTKDTEDKEGLYRYAEEFHKEVQRIYDEMDSNFNFSAAVKGAEPPKADGGKESTLDLRGVACPLNYVKTKLYLETQDQGALVDVYLDDGEPIANVPKSLENDGQEIVDIKRQGSYFVVRVRKLK